MKEISAFKINRIEFCGSAFSGEQYPPDLGFEVAFFGRSNVGKSSLINKLAGRKKLVKTSRTPGRTRTINFFRVEDAFYFVDLPGYGFSKAPKSISALWESMLQEYLTLRARSIFAVKLIDIRRDVEKEELLLENLLFQKSIPGVWVITKIDKLNKREREERIKILRSRLGENAIPFSTVCGVGRDELMEVIFGNYKRAMEHKVQ